IQPAEFRKTLFGDETTTHRILDRLRLLADLLEHEVVEAALLDFVERPIDAAHALRDASRIEVENLVAFAGEHAHLAIVEIHDLARVLKNRGDVAGDVELALAKPDEQRASLSRAHDLVGILTRDHRDPVRPLHEIERVDDRVLELTVERRLDQVSENLG